MKILNRFPQLLDLLPRSMKTADITDMARWFYVDNPTDQYDLKRDLPCNISPFQEAWFEWDFPNKFNKEGEYLTINTELERVGCFISQVEFSPDRGEDYVRNHFIEYALQGATGIRVGSQSDDIRDIVQDCHSTGEWPRFLTTITPTVASLRETLNPGVIVYYSDRWGRLCGRLRHASLNEKNINFTGIVYPLFFALNLMHSKNIKLSAETGKAKRYTVKGQKYTVRYNRIRVDGFSHMSSGRVGEGGWHVAQHYRRGHFKTYTDAAPLFGKHVGTFWIPPTIVGNKNNGIVESEYDIERPG